MTPNKTQQLISKDLLNAKMVALTKPIKLRKTASCIVNASFSLNPLVAAAAPILAAINQVGSHAALINPHKLQRVLTHEIKTFEEKARKLSYRSAIILAARYFLCCYADEMIASSTQPLQDFWQRQPLLQKTQGEAWGGERFFLILERACDDANDNLHLLELSFLCLNLGYQGKYHKPPANLQELDTIKENLFELIKGVRGQYSSVLFHQEAQQTKSVINKYRRPYRLTHWIVASLLLVSSLIAVYIPYHYYLTHAASTVEAAMIPSTEQ